MAGALALAACSGQRAPSVARLGTTSHGSGATGAGRKASTAPSLEEFARCMRSHGVSNWPDPVSSGGRTRFFPGPGSGIDVNSPIVRSALAVCRKYIPGSTLTPAQSAQDEAQLLEYARCMRSHGVTDFPDPTPRPGNGWGFTFPPGMEHSSSPAYLRADQACKSLEP